MHHPIKVYLFGSEKNGWALDTDLALTKESLSLIPETVTLTSLQEADVVHSVWEEPLLSLDQEMLAGKRVVCHICNNLMRLYENPVMIRAADTVGLWVAMAQEAANDLEALQYPYAFVPYSVDTKIFQPLSTDIEEKNRLREKYAIPQESFVISNFMRDSFGHDLDTPKDQKGVELLLEVGCCLGNAGIPVHFLLAGPRRHWIRSQLQHAKIPYTFVGKETIQDDLESNIQTPETINALYQASDLHLITSRWEGGPRSVLEAAATKTPILSTRVGIAPDILSKRCLIDGVDVAVKAAADHYQTCVLDTTIEEHYQTILERHTPRGNAALFQKLYSRLDKVPAYTVVNKWVKQPVPLPSLRERVSSAVRRIAGKPERERKLCISLWHEFHKPPYGGGNQFMMALKAAMERQGVHVVTNKLSGSVDVHICNSCWFDHGKFEKKAGAFPIRMIHRIDGPVTLYRGEGREVDEKIFSLNEQLASATIFQSAYSFKKSYELGFRAVSPIIIHNSVNDEIFNKNNRLKFDGKRKIRLITSAWSDNPRKGGALLKWLDQNLDWNLFDYTFAGRVNERFENIEHIQAVPSEELANLLRQHDIYISVSEHEPCSNALLEALACGLPALYRDDGGNPELVSFGGLPFTDERDVLLKLERIATNLSSFQKLIYLRSIDDITSRYINLARRICAWQA